MKQILRSLVLLKRPLTRANAEIAMCEKCIEIDKTIERYRQIQRAILDPDTVERAKELIADLENQKAALHPE